MPAVRILRPPAPADVEIIRGLEAAARRRDGHESLGASVWRDLAARSGGPAPESTGLLATRGDQPMGYLHLAPSDTLTGPHLVAGLVVHPDFRASAVARELLDAARAEVTARGGGRVLLWVNGVDDALDRLVTTAGFTRFSEQLQMRVPLPLAEAPKWPPGIAVRAYVPGADDAEWLRVNNRAFAGHPDQGGWSETTLARRRAEPWFDPAGFLLAVPTAESGERVAGFCWTKVHEADAETGDERLGEIYVIGVDPDHQGTGLGRALTVAGLDHLASVRGCTTGLLYVDGANAAAVGLYRALGFSAHRTDRAYELELAP